MAATWTSDAVLNAKAEEDAARAQTVMLHPAIPDGSNQVATATPAFESGGDPGPEASWQPAQVGVAHAAPQITVPAGTVTHISYHDESGMWGWDELVPSVTFAVETDHVFYISLGPRA